MTKENTQNKEKTKQPPAYLTDKEEQEREEDGGKGDGNKTCEEDDGDEGECSQNENLTPSLAGSVWFRTTAVPSATSTPFSLREARNNKQVGFIKKIRATKSVPASVNAKCVIKV